MEYMMFFWGLNRVIYTCESPYNSMVCISHMRAFTTHNVMIFSQMAVDVWNIASQLSFGGLLFCLVWTWYLSYRRSFYEAGMFSHDGEGFIVIAVCLLAGQYVIVQNFYSQQGKHPRVSRKCPNKRTTTVDIFAAPKTSTKNKNMLTLIK